MTTSTHALTKVTTISKDDVLRLTLDPDNSAVAETDRGVAIADLTPFANVQQYGAVGDGVTDDTAAIQAAVDSGNNTYIPPGTYACSAGIKIPDNHTLFGDGASSILIAIAKTPVTGRQSLVYNEDYTNGNKNITIRDIHIKWSLGITIGSGADGRGVINMVDCDYVTISNVTQTLTMSRPCIWFSGCREFNITDCFLVSTFDGAGGIGSGGIFISSDNNTIDVDKRSSFHGNISGNYVFTNNDEPVAFFGGDKEIYGMTVTGNTLILEEDSAGRYALSTGLANSSSTFPTQCRDIVISNNHIEGGINIRDASNDILISNNTFNQTKQGSSDSVTQTIVLDNNFGGDDPKNVQILGNTFLVTRNALAVTSSVTAVGVSFNDNIVTSEAHNTFALVTIAGGGLAEISNNEFIINGSTCKGIDSNAALVCTNNIIDVKSQAILLTQDAANAVDGTRITGNLITTTTDSIKILSDDGTATPDIIFRLNISNNYVLNSNAADYSLSIMYDETSGDTAGSKYVQEGVIANNFFGHNTRGVDLVDIALGRQKWLISGNLTREVNDRGVSTTGVLANQNLRIGGAFIFISADIPSTTYSSVTFWRGDIAYDETPSASGTIGWVCTSSGTPGTWKTFGTIAA